MSIYFSSIFDQINNFIQLNKTMAQLLTSNCVDFLDVD